MRKHTYIIPFLFLLTVFAARCIEPRQPHDLFNTGDLPSGPLVSETILSKYRHLSPQQLLDTAIYYDRKGLIDSALICYNLLIHTPEKDSRDTTLPNLKIKALNGSGVIYYYWMSDYLKAYQLLITALDMCETYPDDEDKFKILANIGNIYSRFDEYSLAKQYYYDALELSRDSTNIMMLLNNIAAAELENGELDSALCNINHSQEINSRHNNERLFIILNTRALVYQKMRLFEPALRDLRLALSEARRNNRIEYEAENLSSLGKLFLEASRVDSATMYIAASNTIARENSLYNIILDNYRSLSKIESSKGYYRGAFDYMERYNGLKDSLFSVDKLVNMNQLKLLNEISKTNRQNEELAVEQEIRDRVISSQKVLLFIMFVVLLSAIILLLFVLTQNKRLNKAYRALFEKNLEIIELQDNSSPKQPKNTAGYDDDGELLRKILAIMEDTEVICNPKFSINVLSSLVEANHIYVSQVINNTLHKNFRSFLNGYRIREAQRLFSESDAAKYTIESVSLQVGYKSRSTFREAFTEITGVSPSFYLKSMQETPKG